jgi:hypoxanthine phosphoribosyltransferase
MSRWNSFPSTGCRFFPRNISIFDCRLNDASPKPSAHATPCFYLLGIFQHVYPPEYENHFDSLMLSAKEIRSRVAQLAELLHEDYVGKRPVLVCTLKGACPFFQHLSDALQDLRQGYDVEFVRVSSYDGTNSTGSVKVMGELQLDSLKGRHVVVFEDIVDTGTTLANIMPILEKDAQPASLQVCTLLDKRLSEPKKFQAKYVGFSIPDHFIIGYGLDYNQLYRDLKDIFVISKTGIDFEAKKLHV